MWMRVKASMQLRVKEERQYQPWYACDRNLVVVGSVMFKLNEFSYITFNFMCSNRVELNLDLWQHMCIFCN